MDISIGQYNTLEVMKEADPGLYLGSEVEMVLLPWRYVSEGTKVGELVHRSQLLCGGD